jgi:hypothetical protein
MDERIKRKIAMDQIGTVRESILHKADRIKRMYTEMEDKLARNRMSSQVKPSSPVERLRERIEDLKLEERLKRQSAMGKDAKVRDDLLRKADVIKRMYTELEEKLARNSPTIYPKKKETFATRKIREQVLKRRREAEWAKSIEEFKRGTYKSKQKPYEQQAEESEIYRERASAKKALKEMAENPEAFEAKMKKEEQEEFDKAVSGAFGTFQKEAPDPGYLELLSQPSPAKQDMVPAIMPFKAMSDPGKRRSKRSKSKRARSANHVSKGRKTPEWAKRKKARPAPVRSRGAMPKSRRFTGRYA